MEPNNTRLVAKRLWNIVRIVFFMIRKGISKNKMFMVHLHNMMTKRGKLAGKAIGNLMFHHHNHNPTTFTYRSQNPHMSFFIPRDYEFSCSSSPAASYFPFHVSNNKRKTHRHRSTVTENDVTTVTAVQKLLEMLNNEVAVEGSPVLPGFGRSPMVRQLRITDSPFPLRDVEEDSHVDEDAEEFIERFYAELRLQQNTTAVEESSRQQEMWVRSPC
ncbi:Protein of unknown function DUF761 [Macleaya cordata]|uniref:Avr9/Cf-9 rapidly elicited protein n=1 Tax=Macleaya cordata TaxID=56857 RepID=A0A200QDK9_MACCD|nr:Protein of unknown function DUF761 [Macleaya cordata]